jgi:hydroxyacylglutathione hydrolase
MRSWSTTNGTQVIQVLFEGSNSFLIKTTDLNILVDTGYKFMYRKLLSNLTSLKADHIDYLIQTHTHFDHCHNAANLKERFNCQIIAGEKEKEFIEQGFTPIPAGTHPITKSLSNIGTKIDLNLFHYKAFKADIPINGHYSLTPQIHIIQTPGHSSGSISIIVDNEIALVGDAMIGIFKNTVFPPFADDVKEMIDSWKILLDTGCKTFLSGHGGPISRSKLMKDFEARTIKN